MHYLWDTMLTELKTKMLTCKDCRLCESRTQIVFGEGNTNSPKIMIVGEAPGEDEDVQGTPFVGKCGQKLDQILKYAGINRQDIYIANSVLCRPPNNRPPTIDEISACRWRLHLQIKLIQPKLIVLLGKTAMTAMLGKEIKGPLKQYFGPDWLNFTIDGQEFKAISTYHPSYIMRSGSRGTKEVLPHWTQIRDFIK